MKNTAKEIREAIENSDVEFFAVRATDDDMKVGDICRASRDWDYEHDQPSDKLLDGACGTGFRINWGASDEKNESVIEKAIKYNTNNYYANHHYIIAGNDVTGGDDAGELIIKDAVVLYVID